MTTDERYLWRLRRAAERLRLLAAQWEGGRGDVETLHTLEIQIGTLTYHANLANMKAATRRPEDHDDETTVATDHFPPLRRAS